MTDEDYLAYVLLKDAQESIQRVRNLHELFEYPKWESDWCGHCSSPDDDLWVVYPCETIKALDGEQ